MTDRSWERWGALLGIPTVILWVVAFAIAGSTPSTDDNDTKITTYFVSHSHQVRQIAAFFIFLAGALCFIAFLAVLRNRLAAAEGPGGWLTGLAFGSGLVSAGLWILAIAFVTGAAFMTNDTKPSSLDANTYRFVNDLGYEIWVSAVIVGALLVWATSAVALRTGILPRWFAWLGVLVGVILLLAIFFIPAFVFWGWILVASALLTWRRSETPAVTAT